MASLAMYVAVFYAVCLLVGGVIAYFKAGSKASLVAGIGGGIAFAFVAFLEHLDTPGSEKTGEVLGLLASLAFTAIFGYRFYSTGKAMPAIPLLVLSALVFLTFAFSAFG
eukprot:TRINITY_DN3732_c0_g1_i1.p1 TRINITY_DN3732_c0_g1~~TRINITY_DN3732_c0_g1_i1.p1  ORF type:complete len:110 (+),score=18.79 TRINITY_DN3732_c0_g1_i1:188-517(+)